MSVARRLRLSRIEARRLAHLAAPILGAQLAQIGMGTLDIAMSGHVNAATLAAVSVGSSIWLPALIFIIGTLMGLTPIVAQAVGARDYRAIRPALHQALWVAFGLGLILAVGLYRLADALLGHLDVPADVAALAARYLQAVAFGLPAIAGYETLRFYSDGLGHTRASLLFALLGLAVNAVANTVLIFGGDGLAVIFGPHLPAALARLPALGATGCGLATAISMWSMLVGLFLYSRRARAYGLARIGRPFSAPSARMIGEQLRIGLPIGVSIFAEVSLFTAITLLLARYGEVVVSAHTVALNFSSVLFMIPLSLGLALTVRVGQARGRGKYRHARFVAYNGLAVGLALALVIDAILVFGGPYAVGWYSDNLAVQRLAINLLLVATVFQFSDAAQVTLSGALRGYKDTRTVMWVTVFAYWVVGLGTGHVLGRGLGTSGPGLGVYGYWIGLIAGLSAAAVLLAWRLRAVTRGPRVRAIQV
ncbi:MATE family efflux transporter [Salinisphaera sp. Q1T1-3]|uniref:MATE family efflux transporter n=1 Tax=Salinisphaera sp. Q1T1-3 TaxID=2321229 RepID=UPI000E74716E|nr:MATE family efflux transporter [Salinisphaera sp. Q1T1-3]RJS94081.1 MATE family efflux transporter [Salinisphaera sp. Q1T1-3]